MKTGRSVWPFRHFLGFSGLLISAYLLMQPYMAAQLSTVDDSLFVSVPMFVAYAIAAIGFVACSGIPRHNFGLTVHRGSSVLFATLWVTLPLLLLMTLAHSEIDALLETTAKRGNTDSDSTIGLLFIYLVFVPVQEFVIRGTFLGALLYYKPRHAGVAVVVSALVYSLVHGYLGIGVCALVFLPGLLWGWLFYHTRSLLAVSLSHAACGVYALFFLNLF